MLTPLVRPRRLRPGDVVTVVAPSGPVSATRLKAGLEALASLDLDVRLGEHLLDAHPLGYLAGDDDARAADLQAAWLDPEVAAVLCARGGYGAPRIVDRLDWDAMAARDDDPPALVGYSDVTALHDAVATRLGVATLHAPMIATTTFTDEAGLDSLRATLLDPASRTVLTSPTAGPLVPGRATGVTVGGCLSLIASSLGTPDQRRPEGGIVLLEDVGEALYRLDGYLTHLLRAGWFDGVAAIALGSWQDCPGDVRALMLDRLGDLGVPVAWELGFGHGPAPLTVPLGVEATLDVPPAGPATLTLAHPALR